MTEPAGYVMDAKSAVTQTLWPASARSQCKSTAQTSKTAFMQRAFALRRRPPTKASPIPTSFSLKRTGVDSPPRAASSEKLATFDIITAVGDVDTVTAAIDPEALARSSA